MCEMEKKIRFTDEEVEYLKELIIEKSPIINNKNTDQVSLLSKKQAWTDIVDEFNKEPLHMKVSFTACICYCTYFYYLKVIFLCSFILLSVRQTIVCL